MAEEQVIAWPRPYFKACEQATKLFFVCFGRAPLADVELSRDRFGLPSAELIKSVELREHARQASPHWFEGWWSGPFAAIAEQDLEADLPLLTSSDICFTLKVELEDQASLAPAQTV